MKNFKRNLLEDFCKKDERIRNLYNQIENHPAHVRKLEVQQTFNDKKGSINYYKNTVTIEIDISYEDESVLILGHELMHYLLVLNGALLPVPKKDPIPNKAESLQYMLMKSITHHFLLKKELDLQGFQELQIQFALSNKVYDARSDYYHDDEFWLIDLYDKSTFATEYDFENLKKKFEAADILPIYELLQSSAKETIEDINEISKKLIEVFKFEEYLGLADLNGYTDRK